MRCRQICERKDIEHAAGNDDDRGERKRVQQNNRQFMKGAHPPASNLI